MTLHCSLPGQASLPGRDAILMISILSALLSRFALPLLPFSHPLSAYRLHFFRRFRCFGRY